MSLVEKVCSEAVGLIAVHMGTRDLDRFQCLV